MQENLTYIEFYFVFRINLYNYLISSVDSNYIHNLVSRY
jgi:hypothetical protein